VEFSPSPCATGIEQSFNVTPRAPYDFSFRAYSIPSDTATGLIGPTGPNGPVASYLTVTFGGIDHFNGEVTGSTYYHFHWVVGDNNPITTITFRSINYTSSTVIDNISVTPTTLTGVVSTPEPASLALVGTGFLGLVPFIRRKRAHYGRSAEQTS